jgi:hypothetical protein
MERVDEVQLSGKQDSIVWKPCTDRIYSAVSAYEFQFHGRLLPPHLEKVWQAMVEGKVKFFLWLMLRNRNWTADRMLRRGLPCNAICSLCDQEPETTAHWVIGCSYSKEVWAALSSASTNAPLASFCSQASSIRSWWSKIQFCVPKT